MVQSKRERADVMEAMEEYSKNFASKDVSWISSALNEPEKEKTRHTTKAWNVVGRPLKKTVGTGLPSMYSNGIIKRSVVIVKEATKINSNTRVWIGGMELNFESRVWIGGMELNFESRGMELNFESRVWIGGMELNFESRGMELNFESRVFDLDAI